MFFFLIIETIEANDYAISGKNNNIIQNIVGGIRSSEFLHITGISSDSNFNLMKVDVNIYNRDIIKCLENMVNNSFYILRNKNIRYPSREYLAIEGISKGKKVICFSIVARGVIITKGSLEMFEQTYPNSKSLANPDIAGPIIRAMLKNSFQGNIR